MNVYGSAGGSLSDSEGWASSQRAASSGRVGEIEVARAIADAFRAERNVHVFHDLRLPGYKANIDHVVVGGKKVLILDAKHWRPGFYWTLGGKTRRGRERIEWADKSTLGAAVRVLSEMFDGFAHDVGGVSVEASLMIVPSSKKDKLSLWAYRTADGANVRVVSPGTSRWLRRQVDTRREVDDRIVEVLRSLVLDQKMVLLHGQIASEEQERAAGFRS